MNESADRDAERVRMLGLYAQAKSHPIREVHDRWNGWRIVDGARRRNQRDLLTLIDAPARDQALVLKLQTEHTSDVRRAYFHELYRLLHNYLASVKTLVDYSRRLVLGYEGSDFATEYETRKSNVIKEPVSVFVQDLRNVVLHQSLPALSFQMRIPNPNRDEYEFEVQMDPVALVEMDRFTDLAKVYLRQHTEPIPVKTPVTAYSSLIDDLSKWLDGQFNSLHGEEIAEHDALIREAESIRNSLDPPF